MDDGGGPREAGRGAGGAEGGGARAWAARGGVWHSCRGLGAPGTQPQVLQAPREAPGGRRGAAAVAAVAGVPGRAAPDARGRRPAPRGARGSCDGAVSSSLEDRELSRLEASLSASWELWRARRLAPPPPPWLDALPSLVRGS